MEQNLSNMYCDTKNTVLVCEQMPYPVWFSWRRKSFPEYCEYSLKVDTLGTREEELSPDVGRRPTRLRPKAEYTSGEAARRLDRNRKPRMKSLWHPGYKVDGRGTKKIDV